MAIDEVVASLFRIPLFAGLKPMQIAEIGRRAQRCAFGGGEAIIRTGEVGYGAYLILSGEAGRKTGARGSVEPVPPGTLLGEFAMLIEHVYGATVVAESWVDCLKLERATLRDQMREDPDIAKCIAQEIRARLTLVATELQEIDRLLAGSIEQSCGVPRLLPPPRAVQAAVNLGVR
jgi:CRP-like cAMP-binding protein